jgi:hypothetical protein
MFKSHRKSFLPSISIFAVTRLMLNVIEQLFIPDECSYKRCFPEHLDAAHEDQYDCSPLKRVPDPDTQALG